jgi:hypothetical protein
MRAYSLAVLAGLLLLSAAPAYTQTVRPAAPFITVGANIKELVFDWEPVAGAVNYRLMANTGARGYFEPVGDRIPASRSRAAVAVPVHVQEWWTRRYLVLACNLAGCTRSNEVQPTDQMLDAIGYLKASNTGALDGLGAQVALSADGSTLAVSADGESGASNSAPDTGAVYIYRRNGRKWTQEALLRTADGLAGTRLGGGSPLAFRHMGLSANGSTLAVGAPTRDSAGHANAGMVFVFQRAADNRWSETAQFSASPAIANDYFGYSVDVSSDGTVIKASSLYPQGGAGTPEGRTHIWNWTGSFWDYSGAIAPHYAGDRCPTTRMTADARLLVFACRTPAGEGRLVTHRRVAEKLWSRVADQTYLWFENPNMAVTYDGSMLAVHARHQYVPEGGLAIYLRENFTWKPDAHWIPPTSPGFNGWGHALEFSRHGEYLAVGDPTMHASGAGVSEGWTSSFPADGTVMILKRRPGSIPEHYFFRMVKASNPGDLDRFGESVAFGGPEGFYLAVGAPGEDSNATGVDGDQLNDGAQNAGAAYLY